VGSDPIAESDLSGNITDEYVFFGGKRIAHRKSSGEVDYYFADHLGTSRIVTNATGTILDDSDFYPFGGERTITNTCPQNYKFQGKERDTETGNDDFGARYYSSSFGRWLSPDWSAIPAPVPYADLTNPQTLNLYQFVKNDPETFTDPDGHNECGPTCPASLFDNAGGNGAGGDYQVYYDHGPPVQIAANTYTFNTVAAQGSAAASQAGQSQGTPSQNLVQNQGQSGTSSQPRSTAQTLSAVRVDKNDDYLSTAVDWKLSNESKAGGWVVQHEIADWNNNSTNKGHWDYWEAWFIPAGKTVTNYHNIYGFDDRFSGGFGTKIHTETRFYEGLKLPSSFKVNGVKPAGGLRSVLNANAPQLSTAHATAPVIRDWNP
jgi:RHS repeat-associated protein